MVTLSWVIYHQSTPPYVRIKLEHILMILLPVISMFIHHSQHQLRLLQLKYVILSMKIIWATHGCRLYGMVSTIYHYTLWIVGGCYHRYVGKILIITILLLSLISMPMGQWDVIKVNAIV